jgi:hypothetical protein
MKKWLKKAEKGVFLQVFGGFGLVAGFLRLVGGILR